MDSLVTTGWLAERTNDPDLVILDASLHLPAAECDAAAEFAASHIPGARFLDLASFRDTASPLPNTVPTAAQAAERLGSLGIGATSRIVLYDDSALRSAARAWFLLRGFGMREVAILDGGLAKWRAEGRPLATGRAPASPGDRTPAPFGGPLRDKDHMIANLATQAEQVVDARDAARFAADESDAVHGLAGGHIPGARHLFYRDLFAADGTYRPRAALRAAFENAGIALSRPITASCGSGVTASVLLFALHLLGVEGALYDGSWSEWGADPATPKASGPA